jgi:hypothetical protein
MQVVQQQRGPGTAAKVLDATYSLLHSDHDLLAAGGCLQQSSTAAAPAVLSIQQL